MLERFGLGLPGERDSFLMGAVDDKDFRSLLREPEDCRPRSASRAQHGDARAFEPQAPFQGPQDSWPRQY